MTKKDFPLYNILTFKVLFERGNQIIALNNNKVQQIRNSEYHQMLNIFDMLYEKSVNNEGFRDLIKFIVDENNIILAFRNLKTNSGSKTPGTNGRNIEHLKKLSNEEIIDLVKEKINNYNNSKIKRVYIPKDNGEKRPLGIPNIEDRLVQQCIKQILEPICEAKFNDNSYGFRPNRSVEHAIAQSYKLINLSKTYYIVNIDIKGFFDNVNHRKLRQQMWTLGIRDKKLLKVIDIMLKSEIVEPDNKIINSSKGTPQGGVLSPLLSNIVLNELDWWIHSQWQGFKTDRDYTRVRKNGTLDNSGKYTSLRRKSKLKEMYIVRYADDFKIFCKNYQDAKKTYEAVKDWLYNRLGLEVNEEKSGIVNVRKQPIKFLGFKIKAIKKKNKYVVKSHIDDMKIKNINKKLKTNLRNLNKNRSLKENVDLYNSKVIGIQNYYNLATHINADLGKLAFDFDKTIHNRYKGKFKVNKVGEIKNTFIKDNYGKSSMLRFINGYPIIPIGYVKHKNPMNKRKGVNKYTKKGRELIHTNLGFSIKVVNDLLSIDKRNRSVEYYDNRISKYCAQYGECFISGIKLNSSNLHCHHVIPYLVSQDDSYDNLVILHEDIHKLVHATRKETIDKYLKLFNLDSSQIKKLNKFRKILGNENILV